MKSGTRVSNIRGGGWWLPVGATGTVVTLDVALLNGFDTAVAWDDYEAEWPSCMYYSELAELENAKVT